MIRRIIQIDEEKCNGCAACALACHEGAIEMRNGKAHLMRDDYCDGLGDCLPKCPTGAITFVEREALEYDEKAVEIHKAERMKPKPCSCPGTAAKSLSDSNKSELSQWPIQIKLLPTKAPFYDNADILIAADCTAYAYGDFHSRFIKGRITLIACPKLDNVDYTEKLAEILRSNTIKSITLTRMQVQCCGGLENAIKRAIELSGKNLPFETVIITSNGDIL